MKKALITGITGQDGSYLAEFYWKKVMRCMAPYAARRLTSASVLLILKDNRIFTFTMLTSATQ